MIPVTQQFNTTVTEKTYATKDFQIVGDTVMGRVDGREAVSQAIYLALNTERYEHIPYTWNYGVEFEDLYGKSIAYVLPELKRRITEALKVDSRIKDVTDFEFTRNRDSVIASFTVQTQYGAVSDSVEVNV